MTDSIGGANEIDDGIVEEPRPEAPYAPAEYAADPVDYTPRSDDIAHAPAAAVQPEHPVEDADAAAPHAPAAETNRPWRSLLVPAAVCLWLAGTLVCLLPILLGRMSLLRLARRSRRIIGGSWATLAKRASDAIGLQHEAIILQSDDEPMPMVWGTFRPKLLLPAQAESWSADRRWVVLLHELAHAKRRDCLWKLIAHVACSFYWFNPLCWLAFKLMQREAEAACDDLVLSRGTAVSPVRPSDYATHLLEIASGLKSGMLAAYSSIALARRSRLEGRLLAILDNNRNRRALTRIGIIVLAAAAAAIAIPLACMKPAEPKTSLQEAQRQVIALKVLLKDAPVTTDIKSLEIFEKTPGMAGEYRIRKDVQRRELPIATEEKPFINSGIFYLPEKNVYYIQYDDAGASTLHYYGPFEGDPDKLDLEAAAKLTPAGAAETDNYDRFVFVRMDTENGKQVRRLVLAKALSEGFDKKDICVCSDEIPLCAANGTLYTLSYETLYAVDIATGRRDVVDDGVRAWDFHDGKLYAAGKQDGQILIYDFERRARKIVNLQGFRPSGLIAVSPDGRHIATFARLKLEGTDLLSPQLTQIRTLQILDTETWKVSEPCKAVTIPGSLTDNNPSMKPAWLDNKTILFQHAGIVETIPDENTIEKPSDIRVPTDLFAATADIESGRIRNFADNAAFTLDFDRPDAAGDLIVILYNFSTGARRCRVDAEAV